MASLGGLGVIRRRAVEGRGDDLTLHRALHIGDLFAARRPGPPSGDTPGLLRVIAYQAMSCMIVVLPALGARRSARWPLPIGMIRSMTRVVSFSVVVSRRSR